MFSACHETKCGIDAAGRKRPIRKRSQRTIFDQTTNVLQHLTGQSFITMKDRVHCHDMERSVVAERSKWDTRVLVNVAFADLDQATELGETRKTHRYLFAGQGVENPVYAFAIGELHHRLGKIAASRVDYVFDPERFKQRAFAWASGSGNDLRAEVQGDLDRGHSDSTRACVHEHALTLAQSPDVSQRIPGGHENDRQCCRCLKCQAGWNAPHIARPRRRVGGDSKYGETEHTISWNELRDIRTNRPNDATHFVAKNTRIRSITRIERQRLKHIAEIHSGRFHFDQYLARAALRQSKWREVQGIEAAAFPGFQT